MLVLIDGGFKAGEFLAKIAGTRAVPGPARCRPPAPGPGPPARRLGSCRSSASSRSGSSRHRSRSPARTEPDTATATGWPLPCSTTAHLAAGRSSLCIIERWENQIAYLALRHTLLGGRVLRSGDPAGLGQEMWAMLTVYQALRIAISEAIETTRHRPRPGQLPDRRRNRPDPGHRRPRRHRRARRPGRRHRPRSPSQPARAAPAPRLRPPGQIPAEPLEQAPARQTPDQPEDHQRNHRHQPLPGRKEDTPPTVLDHDARTLTPRHCG